MSVPGLYYFDSMITNSSNIISNLDSTEWSKLSTNPNSRMVKHYGYKYDYKTYNIKQKCQDIPNFLFPLQNSLITKCKELNLIDNSYLFNQCIVNNYQPGQGISKHIDVKSYGDVIGCFTLGSTGAMIFRKNKNKVELPVLIDSLYIMSGESRYSWTHEMPSRKYDTINNNKVKRERRISVTFRNVS